MAVYKQYKSDCTDEYYDITGLDSTTEVISFDNKNLGADAKYWASVCCYFLNFI